MKKDAFKILMNNILLSPEFYPNSAIQEEYNNLCIEFGTKPNKFELKALQEKSNELRNEF